MRCFSTSTIQAITSGGLSEGSHQRRVRAAPLTDPVGDSTLEDSLTISMHPALAATSRGLLSPHPYAHSKHTVPPYQSQQYHHSRLRSEIYDTERRKDLGLVQLPPVTPAPAPVTSIYLEAPIRDGLRTPPSDDMNSTASYSQQYNGYTNRKDVAYSDRAAVQPYPTKPQAANTSNTAEHLIVSGLPSHSYNPAESPQSVSTATIGSDDMLRRKSVILPSLQIPPSINNSGGSLGEFAAQITCLFWFESTATLRRAEELPSASSPVKRLVPDAIPTVSFRKWVVTILSTTQVTQNVILLALLFIYRLKTLNPTVKGKAGSEYRLLTVALMLGNKFLDDNTYTNKTWAEVSGISVGEIHVMEVEFLSNMRYSLLASKEQWKEWQIKLGRFWEYFERAARVPSALPSPSAISHSSVLPSPAGSIELSPPVLTSYPPNSVPYNYNQQWPAQAANLTVAPLPSLPDLVPALNLQPSSRKRGYDESASEPPTKRMSLSNPPQMTPHPMMPIHRQNVPRLPVPGLSVSTQTGAYSANAPNLTVLPPLVGGRAMSTVYPSAGSWTPQSQASLTPTTSTMHSATIYGTPSVTSSGALGGTPSRRHSPRSVQDALSMNSSPISGNFTHNLNSPSFFLQQRSSPYRPVRPPNTLLYPPPSGSLHNFSTNTDQMHYQPLGKRNDYRTGIVPEYTAHLGYHNWPALPQPNFQA